VGDILVATIYCLQWQFSLWPRSCCSPSDDVVPRGLAAQPVGYDTMLEWSSAFHAIVANDEYPPASLCHRLDHSRYEPRWLRGFAERCGRAISEAREAMPGDAGQARWRPTRHARACRGGNEDHGPGGMYRQATGSMIVSA
jgi:hypothetical protein